MPKVTKNHLNANQIDFGFTALNSLTYPSMQMKLTDTIEYYDVFGNVATSYTVEQLVDFIEENKLNDTHDMHIDYLDHNFDEVTKLFLLQELDKKEVRHAA